jgi:hypothetical protein
MGQYGTVPLPATKAESDLLTVFFAAFFACHDTIDNLPLEGYLTYTQM